MKTTKRVIAVVLTVLMLALMVPFAASADEKAFKATIEGKEGYGVTFVKVATYNETTGKYMAVDSIDASIKNYFGTNGVAEITSATAASIREAIELAIVEKKVYGDAEGRSTVDFTNKDGKWVAEFGTDNPGIYYAAVTKSPATAKSTGGSLFYLADATNAAGNSMAIANASLLSPVLKLDEGEVRVDKKIVGGKMNETASEYQTTASAQEDDKVTFSLTTTVPGSAAEYLTKYTVHDIMSDKLTFAGVDTVSVTVGGEALTKGALTGTVESGDFYVVADSQSDIQIVFTQDYLNKAHDANQTAAKYTKFYAENTNVVTTLQATINANSDVGRTTGDDDTDYDNTVGNWNKDKLTWTNRNGQSDEKTGNTVHVYTFNVPIIKVKTGTTTGLGSAVFTLTGENLPENGISVTTGADGRATFEKLKAGSYTLEETTAPDGYNKITKTFTVTVDAETGNVTVRDLEKESSGVKALIIPNTPVVMPSTGGQGTMIFTIVGASLIACAGILFIIVRRKKSSK